MKCRYAVVALLVLLSGADAPKEGNKLKQTLLMQEKKITEAIKHKDQKVIKALLHEEAYAITIAGRQFGAEMIRSLEMLTVDDYEISDVKVVKVSDTVGILTYKYTWSGSYGTEKVPKTTVFATSTWALRDGTWQSVFYQETPIAE